jgi:hypothetical protein
VFVLTTHPASASELLPFLPLLPPLDDPLLSVLSMATDLPKSGNLSYIRRVKARVMLLTSYAKAGLASFAPKREDVGWLACDFRTGSARPSVVVRAAPPWLRRQQRQ